MSHHQDERKETSTALQYIHIFVFGSVFLGFTDLLWAVSKCATLQFEFASRYEPEYGIAKTISGGKRS